MNLAVYCMQKIPTEIETNTVFLLRELLKFTVSRWVRL